jgi:large subunit ribosomal protein L10
MARSEKEAEVKRIQDKLRNSACVVLTEFRGLNVHELAELRRRLREKEIEYKVVKNTLVRIAANEVGLSELNEYLTGPTALVAGLEDIISPAKILFDFSKEHDALKIKGGILEGKVLDANKVKALANLPSREELIGRLMGNLNGPIVGLVNVLSAPLRGFVGVLTALAEQKAKTTEA